MARMAHSEQMIEFTSTPSEPYHEVEVKISPDPDGYTLWVNVDGKCRLRATHIPLSALNIDLEKSVQRAMRNSSS